MEILGWVSFVTYLDLRSLLDCNANNFFYFPTIFTPFKLQLLLL